MLSARTGPSGCRTKGTSRKVFVPQLLSAGAMEPRSPKQRESFHRRMLEERMRHPEFLAEYERMRAEMFEQLAPAIEGPS